MKKLLILIFSLWSISASSQTLSGKKVIARTQFQLKDWVITGIERDTTNFDTHLTVPTSKAVYDFVVGRLAGFEGGGGSIAGIQSVHAGLYLGKLNDSTLFLDTAALFQGSSGVGAAVRRKDSSVNGGYYPYASNPKGYLTQISSLHQTLTAGNASTLAARLGGLDFHPNSNFRFPARGSDDPVGTTEGHAYYDSSANVFRVQQGNLFYNMLTMAIVSTDVNLGSSNSTLSTQMAVKTYVDNKNLLNLKYADSASMLNNYRHWGLYSLLGHTHAQSDITGLVSALAAKQATLVSGTNIKTINGNTILGSGDLAISTGGSAWDDLTGNPEDNEDLMALLGTKSSIYENFYIDIDKTHDSLAWFKNDSTWKIKSLSITPGSNKISVTPDGTDSTQTYVIDISEANFTSFGRLATSNTWEGEQTFNASTTSFPNLPLGENATHFIAMDTVNSNKLVGVRFGKGFKRVLANEQLNVDDTYFDFANQGGTPADPGAGYTRIQFINDHMYLHNGDGQMLSFAYDHTSNRSVTFPDENSQTITVSEYAKLLTRQSAANPTGTITWNAASGGQYSMTFTSTTGRTLAFSNISSGFQGVAFFDNTSGGTVTLTLPSNSFVMNSSGVYTSASDVTVPEGKTHLSLAHFTGSNYWFVTSW